MVRVRMMKVRRRFFIILRGSTEEQAKKNTFPSFLAFCFISSRTLLFVYLELFPKAQHQHLIPETKGLSRFRGGEAVGTNENVPLE